jgi:hypothetical protein
MPKISALGTFFFTQGAKVSIGVANAAERETDEIVRATKRTRIVAVPKVAALHGATDVGA